MGRSHIVALLAGVGITLIGPMTHDAVALAMALETGQAKALERFVKEYPHSPYRYEAIQLAKSEGRSGGESGKGRGNEGNGNNGKGGKNGHGEGDHGNNGHDDDDHGDHGHGNNGHGDNHDDDDDDGYHG